VVLDLDTINDSVLLSPEAQKFKTDQARTSYWGGNFRRKVLAFIASVPPTQNIVFVGHNTNYGAWAEIPAPAAHIYLYYKDPKVVIDRRYKRDGATLGLTLEEATAQWLPEIESDNATYKAFKYTLMSEKAAYESVQSILAKYPGPSPATGPAPTVSAEVSAAKKRADVKTAGTTLYTVPAKLKY
jgi:hypothetical protein